MRPRPGTVDEVAWLRPKLEAARLEVVPKPGILELIEGIDPQLPLTLASLPTSGSANLLHWVDAIAARGHRAVPHLAARSIANRDELKHIIARTSAAGVSDVFVIGGDRSQPIGRYSDALALLQDLERLGHRFEHVGVACYPDFHPFLDQERLMLALQAKQRLATYMVSQICFDTAALARWFLKARGAGISLPLYVSIPGVIDVAYLSRLSLRIGVGDSIRFLRKNAGMLAAFRSGLKFVPDQLLRNLGHSFEDHQLAIAGIHMNTFNRVEATERWRADFVHQRAG